MEEVEVTHTEQQLPTPPEDVAPPAFVMPQNLHLAGSAPQSPGKSTSPASLRSYRSQVECYSHFIRGGRGRR